jgi:hypothetical protein
MGGLAVGLAVGLVVGVMMGGASKRGAEGEAGAGPGKRRRDGEPGPA